MTNPKPFIRAFAGPLLLLLASCGGPTAPSASYGLELSVDVVRFDNDRAARPSFTSVLRNRSNEEITVVFSNSCTVRPYIADRRSDTVYPGWEGCYQIVSPVTLAPGASIARTLELERGTPATNRVGTVVLPPGRYVAYAEIDGALGDLGGQRVTLRSRGAPFTLP